MFDIQVQITGDKVIIRDLPTASMRIPAAADRALTRSAKGIYREAFSFLSGPGAKASNVPAGGYPVPVRTGFLRQALDWVAPGQSKAGVQGVVTAGKNEALIYDSAEYARVIHEGTGSSATFGPRAYLIDGLEKFNEGDHIQHIFEEELRRILP